MILIKFSKYVDNRLLEQNFDVNLTDTSNGETFVFTLLRKFDYVALKYLLTTYIERKNISIFLNYYNRSGISPLYLALSLYNDEIALFPNRFADNDSSNNNSNRKDKHLYEYLLSYGASPNDSIKKHQQVSPLSFALTNIDDVHVS